VSIWRPVRQTNCRAPQIERNYPRSLRAPVSTTDLFLLPYQSVASNACSADGVSEIGCKTRPLNWKHSSGYLRTWRRWNQFCQKFPRRLPRYPSTVIPAVGDATAWGNFSCVQRLFFSKVNTATVRVLTANGCEVVIPKLKAVVLPEHQGQGRSQGASSTDD